ncbi:hypothetical protein ACFQMA_00655 [Halosimplex aquaticum]|uniref:DUF4345 domain-containing protein n=1 Tax=Halosimplex aquaticum TaxID=3026162 RepID=A0ABD5XT92_9EURY|nr:hypothetical protein [Halosimplex aquaticum]
MPIDPATAVIAFVSLLGATGVAAVTLRYYEPPPREGEEETPEPYFETAAFFVLTAALFALAGSVIAHVSGLAAPYGRVATLLLTPVGLYSAYATYTGRIADDADEAGGLMGVVSALVLGVYPVAFGVISLL